MSLYTSSKLRYQVCGVQSKVERCYPSKFLFYSCSKDGSLLSEFMEKNPEVVAPDNAMDFLSDNGGTSYNLCHCESSVSVKAWTLNCFPLV